MTATQVCENWHLHGHTRYQHYCLNRLRIQRTKGITITHVWSFVHALVHRAIFPGVVIAGCVLLLLKSALCILRICTLAGYNTLTFEHHDIQAVELEAQEYSEGPITAKWHNSWTFPPTADAKEVQSNFVVWSAWYLHLQSYGSGKQLLEQICW